MSSLLFSVRSVHRVLRDALNPVAGSPPVGPARNSARWPIVVRHVTAAALTLTVVVGAVAYWQLTVHAAQIQKAASSAQLTPAASRIVPETEVLRVAHPKGSQFRGYEPYQVQELVLTARVVRIDESAG